MLAMIRQAARMGPTRTPSDAAMESPRVSASMRPDRQSAATRQSATRLAGRTSRSICTPAKPPMEKAL